MFDKRLMKTCPESKRYVIGNILFQWLELVTNVVMIGVIATMVEDLFDKRLDMMSIALKLCVLAITLVLRFCVTKGATRMSYHASKTIKRVMRELIYRKILRLGNTYREHATSAELVQESVEGVEQLESYFGQYVPQFFYAFLAPITLFFTFTFVGGFKVGLVLLICVPLIPGAIVMVQKIAKKLLSKYWDQYVKLGSTFLENLQGMTTLKIYRADKYKNDQMNAESENFRRITMKVLMMQLNSIIIMDFFAYGGAALGIALAGKAFIDGRISLFAVIFMILLSADFFLPMRKLGSYFHVAMNGMAASDKIYKFLAKEEPCEKPEIFPEEFSEIRLNNISFSYTGEREVLHDVSACIKEGEYVGIVGESGSGKSTIAALLLGKNVLSVGSIMFGDKNINIINEKNLLKNITYVGLSSVFFKGSVRENLLLAEPNATDEMLWQALAESNLTEFLKNEKGLDTMLTENAGNLSGGQKQRLALARALLHDSKIYVFDEATSNIDAESEELILAEIKKLAKVKTVIMITHRLANITEADSILCLKDGGLVGKGTHEELLRDCEEYRKLWEKQKELEEFTRRDSHEGTK